MHTLVESKHLKNAFELKYIHSRADDVNRKKVNKVLNKIPIFEQGAVQANNSTTLCVTLLGVNRIFNCGHVGKRPRVGVESKHLKMLLNSNIFTAELMTSTKARA